MRFALFLLAALPAWAAADASEIMARVAANQDRSEQLRGRYVYRQNTAIRVRDNHNGLTREEMTVYEMFPTAEGVGRKESSFTGKYREGKAMLPYSKSGEPMGEGFRNEADAQLCKNLRDDLTANKNGKDGLAPKLFPLTSPEQAHYIFELKGESVVKGIPVYRIAFRPKKSGNDDDRMWAGEVLVSREEGEPVQVSTKLARGIPLVVRTALGTNLRGLGFTVTYRKFEDGVWFPVSYGTEFDLRVVFIYSRKIAVSLTNTDFKRASADSSIIFDK